MNNSYNALRNVTSFRNNGKSQPISGIELMVDEKNMYFAGNDTGYVMTIDCPYGTQEMANDLLAKAKGFKYQGFTAEQVILPPETELGDGVTVAGVYGMVARRSFKFTPGMTSNIEAPRELEVQHEYKYSSPQQRKTERQIAQTRTLITKTSEEIMLKVEGIDGKYTELKTTVDGVTITDQSGTTKIKGSSIETASIAANAIRADQVNLTGAISWADLDSNVRAEINDRGDDNPSYIKWSYIDSAKIVSPHIYGGDLYATGQGNAAGTNPAFYMSDGVTGSGANTEPNAPKGWLCFDKNGAGTEQEAAERVFLHSQPNVAIKIESGGNMSIDAAGFIHMQAPITLQSGVNYGTAAQRDAITPVNGRIFFVVE